MADHISGVNGSFNPHGSQMMKAQPSPASDLQHRNLFQGYPAYPSNAVSASIPPSLHNGLDHLGPHSTPHTAVAAYSSSSEASNREASLFGDLPESKRRKFINVDKLRVQTNLNQVNMQEIPDSYRERNSVYPRSYFPVQMTDDGPPTKNSRFQQERPAPGGALENEQTVTGRTTVQIPLLEGEAGITVPMIGLAKRARDEILNDMGHRMSWNQRKLFADRGIFLQKSRMSFTNHQPTAERYLHGQQWTRTESNSEMA